MRYWCSNRSTFPMYSVESFAKGNEFYHSIREAVCNRARWEKKWSIECTLQQEPTALLWDDIYQTRLVRKVFGRLLNVERLKTICTSSCAILLCIKSIACQDLDIIQKIQSRFWFWEMLFRSTDISAAPKLHGLYICVAFSVTINFRNRHTIYVLTSSLNICCNPNLIWSKNVLLASHIKFNNQAKSAYVMCRTADSIL